MKAAHCGISNWKFWKKVANGRDDDWSKSSRKKPTAKAEFFPLSSRKARHRRKQSMGLRSVVGRVGLEVWHGQDPQDKHWGCPIRERWGLRAHQQMSPVLEEKLAFTATLTGSYEAAAQVAGKWGCAVVTIRSSMRWCSEGVARPRRRPRSGSSKCPRRANPNGEPR